MRRAAAPARSAPAASRAGGAGIARAARAAALAAALLALAALAPARARAQGAPDDSLLRDYVRRMADSTDAYFGTSAQPADTTGLDSALVFRLAHPSAANRGRPHLSYMPELGFSRVLGGSMGGSATFHWRRGWPSLGGHAAWANGPDTWYGGGEIRAPWPSSVDDDYGAVRVLVERRADGMDRDYQDRLRAASYAFFWGADRQHYLRRDGAALEITRAGAGWWAKAAVRDELESPLRTTSTWTLFHATPVVIDNRAAAAGRAQEVGLELGTRLPRSPFLAELQWWNAGGALGGDFDYRRVRAALGGGVGLGRHLALTPMLEYGRLAGQPVPQAAFTLGGPSSLRSIDAFELQGTGKAFGHLELMLEDPVQSVLRLSRAPTFPLQVSAFAGSGARWGYDPASGAPAASPGRWPGRQEWKSEAGAALIFRPGVPEPDWQARVDCAWPVGQGRGPARWSFGYQRTLSVLSRMLF